MTEPLRKPVESAKRPRRGHRSLQRAPLLTLTLDRGSETPLQRQLYDQLRDSVLQGRLAGGTRLPSSRALAEELGCSRNTVVAAFEQLLSEGYLEGRVGSGSFVASVLPDRQLAVGGPKARGNGGGIGGGMAPAFPEASAEGGLGRLSARSRDLDRLELAAAEKPGSPAFALSFPDTSLFPFDVWGRLLGRIWRRPPPGLLSRGATGGHPPLRAAIASYLRAVRGLACEPQQVLVTAGAQQALDLASRVLLDPGESAWVEEPGYPGLRAALVAAGARAVAVPVDAEGLSLEEGLRLAPEARLAAVAPSHQYPLGVVMSLPRRLALLDWAAARDGWILEDDYDSEYRYAGRPLAALQGLEAARPGPRRVIYVGTFSKVLFPSLRLGYLVAPPDLVEVFLRARRALDDHPSSIAQPALAAFIEEGHFAAHIRRMRRIYAGRQAILLEAAAKHLAGLLELEPDEAGMHLLARLGPALAGRIDDREATALAAAGGITVTPLSRFATGPDPRQGLLLGYAALAEAAIEPAVRRLAAALEPAAR